jgi:glutamate synthase (NADPH) small chain
MCAKQRTDFLDIERKTEDKQPAGERVKHYREFTSLPPEESLRQQAARCMNCGVPFCHGAGCPICNHIPDFNDMVYRGKWREAYQILAETNNLPEITGRLCPAPCEASCVNAIDGKAVTIRQLELAIIEKAWAKGWVIRQAPLQETGKRVAIVGSGPAGLTAAQQLRRAGHGVTVYEKAPRAGGILRYGIPDFKLEKALLDRRLAQMEDEGVKFELGLEPGIDLTPAYLKKRFDAICLCGGAGQPRDLKISGREAKGVHFAMEFLAQSNMRNAGEVVPPERVINAKGRKVVVIGGGDTGSDCVGTSIRQGAASVTQIELLPKPPEEVNEATPWPRWPQILRTSSSHEEGGTRMWSVETTAFKVKNGAVAGLVCRKLEWVADAATGRMAMRPVAGSEFELEADLVLLSMGFVSAVRPGLLEELGVEFDPRGNVKVDANLMTSVAGVFATGDMQTGAHLIVGAIAGGRRMARRVDLFLMGESALPDCPLLPRL